nr:hypothetical protein CFP56_38420 [Quercus suber]
MLGVDSNKLTTQQTISKSILGLTISSPITIEPGECSNNIVETLCLANIHERVENGKKSFSAPARSPVLPIQVGELSSTTSLTYLTLSVSSSTVYSTCLDGKCPDSPTMDGLMVGTSSDGLAVAPVEFISARFYSDGPAVALLELNGSSFNRASFDEVTVVPSKTNLANLQLLKGRFLAETGFVDFGVNNVDKVGSVSSELLFQGADNKGARQIVVAESG